MIGPLVEPLMTMLLQGMAASAAVRNARTAASDVGQRVALTLAAGLAGGAALLCFSHSALTILERRLDPAESWAVLGGFYAVIGGLLYFAAARRRRT